MDRNASSRVAALPRGCQTDQGNPSRRPNPSPAPRNRIVPMPTGWTFRWEFLMGTDDPVGFRDDGEGPVRPVHVDAFRICACAVTNDEFAEFVEATGYVTDAQRYGWTYVFGSFLPAQLRRGAPRPEQAPWWCAVRGPSGRLRRARAAPSRGAGVIPLFTCRGTTRRPIAHGPEPVCPRRPSGSTPPAVD